MEIGGISNSFLNTLTNVESMTQKADEDGFGDKIKAAIAKEDDAALKDACAQFESYYINKVFSEMRKSIPKSDLIESSQGKEMYEDMLYDAYSKEISKGQGAGIKEMLYKQLKK